MGAMSIVDTEIEPKPKCPRCGKNDIRPLLGTAIFDDYELAGQQCIKCGLTFMIKIRKEP